MYSWAGEEGRKLAVDWRKIGRQAGTGVMMGLFLFFCLDGSSQDKKSKKGVEPKSQTIFRLPVNVVVVNATVTDRSGKPVTDLNPEDFRVYDDGKPQPIQTFALESYSPAGVDNAGASEKKENAEPAPKPRLISIVIDDLTMELPADLMRMIQSITDYIKKEVSPMDMIALVSGSGNVQLPFSDDPQQLAQAIPAALKKLNFTTTTRSTCPPLTDLTAWRVADGWHNYQVNFDDLIQKTISCLNLDPDSPASKGTAESYLRSSASQQSQIDLYRTRTLLYTMSKHIRALRHFEGPKEIVFFSDGFLTEKGTPSAYQIQEIVDLALRSGIVMNSVNIRGLAYEAQDSEDMLAQEDPLNQMAYETGGLFFHNDNNFYKAMKNVAQRQSHRYVMSYGMPPHKADGAYHKIRLEVTRPGLQISYRKGYYTQKEQLSFENSKKEDLLAALTGLGNMNEIPMTLSYNYSMEDDSTYSVSFITSANIRGVQFPEEESRRRNIISFVLVAFDENDRYISGLEKSIDFRLLDDSLAGLREQGLNSRVEFKLPVGRYKIKAVVRESTQGKVGSISKAVEIP